MLPDTKYQVDDVLTKVGSQSDFSLLWAMILHKLNWTLFICNSYEGDDGF